MIWYGENCIYDIVIELYKIAEECIAKMRVNTELELTQDDKRNFFVIARNAIFAVVILKMVSLK